MHAAFAGTQQPRKENPFMRVINAALVVALLASQADAAGGPQPTLRLDMTLMFPTLIGPPGTDTPIFHTTAQGQLVLIRGHYQDTQTNNCLASDDRGRTWHTWDAYSTWPKMCYADVVRRGNELFTFGSDGYGPDGTYVWRSSDEGLTWTGGDPLPRKNDTDRWGTYNQRVLLTSTGRLIVPIDQLLGREGPDPDQVGTIWSDDGALSWTQSAMFGPPPGYPTAPEGIGEPAVVDLANGKTWMVARGLGGHLLQAFSDDGGATWGTPSPTTLVSPLSSVIAKRIPSTNAVVTIWNNAVPTGGAYPGLYTPRTPLVFAVSEDNCQTWSEPVVIDTGTAAYPSMCFSGNEMFIAYCADPDPNQMLWCGPNAHWKLVAYDINAIHAPEPSCAGAIGMGLIGLAAYAWLKRR
jgi:hypothetical protein